jgi:DNA-binding transcriptional ArsR family regulator
MRDPVNEASCEMLGNFFSTLAHRTRMRILCSLQGGPRTVTQIAESAGISITNASQHLRIMREGGAVEADKRAQSVYYHIADPRMFDAMRLIREALSERLRLEAERTSPRGARRVNSKLLQTA